VLARFAGEQADQLRWHADHLPLALKAYVEHTSSPADDLAALVKS
jgi:hypothetical protein